MRVLRLFQSASEEEDAAAFLTKGVINQDSDKRARKNICWFLGDMTAVT